MQMRYGPPHRDDVNEIEIIDLSLIPNYIDPDFFRFSVS